ASERSRLPSSTSWAMSSMPLRSFPCWSVSPSSIWDRSAMSLFLVSVARALQEVVQPGVASRQLGQGLTYPAFADARHAVGVVPQHRFELGVVRRRQHAPGLRLVVALRKRRGQSKVITEVVEPDEQCLD